MLPANVEMSPVPKRVGSEGMEAGMDTSSCEAVGHEVAARVHHLIQSLVAKLDSASSSASGSTQDPPRLIKGLLRAQEERLYAAALGGLSFELLRTGYNTGLYRLLHRRPGLRLAEISEALGTDPYPTEVLLLGLVPLKLVLRLGNRYYNNPLLSYAISGSLADGAVGKILEYFHQVINPAAAHLQESVIQNRPVGLDRMFGATSGGFYGAIARDKEHGEVFQQAMRADTQFNRDRIAGNAVFGRVTRVLDVGGNIGELAIAIARRHTNIRITIFDFPEVTARAKERVESEGEGEGEREGKGKGEEKSLANRIDTLSGNFLDDGFPEGYDCVLFSHFLDIFSPTRVRKFMGHAYRCLPRDGVVCVFGSVVDDDDRGPIEHAVLSAYFLCLADGQGRFYSARQTAAAMAETGFTDIIIERLPRNEALIVGRRP